MRWNTVPEIGGNERKRSGFLLFPLTIKGETRWLERAEWVEVYQEPGNEMMVASGNWFPCRWVEENNEQEKPTC